MPAPPVYERTATGRVEVKRLPDLRAYETHQPNTTTNARFRSLFRYLRDHELSMTRPVETSKQEGWMRFFVADTEKRGLSPEGGVDVHDTGERLVASLGFRGGYDSRKAERQQERLRAWLKNHPEWRADGDPHVAYWDGPFVPAFIRRGEVHLPIRPADDLHPGHTF